MNYENQILSLESQIANLEAERNDYIKKLFIIGGINRESKVYDTGQYKIPSRPTLGQARQILERKSQEHWRKRIEEDDKGQHKSDSGNT